MSFKVTKIRNIVRWEEPRGRIDILDFGDPVNMAKLLDLMERHQYIAAPMATYIKRNDNPFFIRSGNKNDWWY